MALNKSEVKIPEYTKTHIGLIKNMLQGEKENYEAYSEKDNIETAEISFNKIKEEKGLTYSFEDIKVSYLNAYAISPKRYFPIGAFLEKLNKVKNTTKTKKTDEEIIDKNDIEFHMGYATIGFVSYKGKSLPIDTNSLAITYMFDKEDSEEEVEKKGNKFIQDNMEQILRLLPLADLIKNHLIYASRGGVYWSYRKKRARSFKYKDVKLLKITTSEKTLSFYDEVYEQVKDIINPPKVRTTERIAYAREGKDYRDSKDISAKELLEEFSFDAVELSETASQKDLQERLNRAYDGMNDIQSLTSLPKEILSMNGGLSLGLGVMGKKGSVAQYFIAQKTINLNNRDGAGSLAHEWLHALDYHMGEGHNPTSHNNNGYFSSILNKIYEMEFYNKSSELDKARGKPYFATRHELMARTFEAYCKYAMAEAEQYNNFLVDFNEKSGVYPSHDDMEILKPLFKEAFKKITKESNE